MLFFGLKAIFNARVAIATLLVACLCACVPDIDQDVVTANTDTECERLVLDLYSVNEEVQLHAIDNIDNCRASFARAWMLERLEHEGDESTRMAIAVALRKHFAQTSGPIHQMLIRNPEPDVRKYMISAIRTEDLEEFKYILEMNDHQTKCAYATRLVQVDRASVLSAFESTDSVYDRTCLFSILERQKRLDKAN
jgi:hypothetical protein